MTVPTRFVTQARRFVILRLPGTNASVLIRWIPRSERKILFTQPIFLFLFLPLLLGTYFSVPWRMRNQVLLGFSLVFYAWGEPRYLPLLVGMVGVDYVMAMSIDREITRSEGRGSWKANLLLGFAISANLGLLLIFKYTDFAVDNLNVVVKCIGTLFPGMRFYGFAEPRIALPLGISFFTFHGWIQI